MKTVMVLVLVLNKCIVIRFLSLLFDGHEKNLALSFVIIKLVKNLILYYASFRLISIMTTEFIEFSGNLLIIQVIIYVISS